MDHESYKEFHESFMRNNNGTTIAEAFITIIPSFFTTSLTINLLTIIIYPFQIPATFLFEFIAIVMPAILTVTALNTKIWQISATLMFITITSGIRQLVNKYHLLPFIQIPAKKPQYIGLLRAITNLLTAVCILAVDFQCFPRKLAKTENFGFGLMDLGVGLYIFCHGIVVPFGQHKNQTLRKSLHSEMMKCFPLIVLGFARFFIINEIDYQQHTTEYGIHWNFFLTLAVTKFIGTIILHWITLTAYAKYIAITVLTVHEMSLQIGLAEYVIDEKIERNTFLAANREGIISIPGYVALYLASIYIGSILKDDTDSITARNLMKKAAKLGFICLILWKIVYVCADMFGVSRRLANMGYVIWTLSFGTTFTTLFMIFEVFYYFIAFDRPQKDSKTYAPIILCAINYNGLAFFLLANLLTGAINMTFQTMLVSASGCVFLVSVYMFVLLSIISFLYLNEIQLKI